jgi:hypothetical protein
MENSDHRDLDDAKERYLKAKQDIEKLRLKIAQSNCPLSVGEVVAAESRGRTVRFLIEDIWFAIDTSIAGELLDPVIGAKTGWTVSGPRIRKTDGQPGKHRFAISSLSFAKDGNIWVENRKTLPQILGMD